MVLSKSEYMMYLRHPAWLWLKKHDKSKLPEVSVGLQAKFDAGHEFEKYAEAHFPDGVQLGFNDYNEYLSLPRRTTQAIADGEKTIFQGRFEHGQITCICDVVRVVGDKEVDLYEIKASSGVKLDHILDLAFQVTVLERCGYRVRDVFVMHVDSSYVRKGEIDHRQIVATQNVTEEVKAELHRTERNIASAIEVMESVAIPDPSPARAKLGSLTEWLGVYKNIEQVGEGSIYELCRLNTDLLRMFEEQKITKLKDIPVELADNKQQRWQLEALANNEPIVQLKRIQKFLAELEYPLYFLDYETLGGAIPLFDGTRPYQQIPFQYSLHVLESPGAALKHFGYLHSDTTSPVEPLCKEFSSQIGEKGTVLAWYMAFEKGCNTTLGQMDRNYAEFFENLNARMNDLMLPFSTGMYVDYHFKGSASIKNVLPVVVPELSYKDLNIKEGETAQVAWTNAVHGGASEDVKAQVLKDLEVYCELDTFAMVEIFRFLSTVAGGDLAKPEQLSIDI